MAAPRDGVDAIVAQWADERPDLDTTTMELVGRVYRIAKHVGDAMERCYARYGITRADFDVMATLRRSGPPFQLAPRHLTASLMLTSGGMTGRLDRLESLGHIERRPDPSDRRCLLVALTPSGRELLDEALVAGLDVHAQMFARLSPTRRRQVADQLREVLAVVESYRDG